MNDKRQMTDTDEELIDTLLAISVVSKRLARNLSIENPVQIPKLNGSDFLKPKRPAFDIDIMLLGPGVTAVIIA